MESDQGMRGRTHFAAGGASLRSASDLLLLLEQVVALHGSGVVCTPVHIAVEETSEKLLPSNSGGGTLRLAIVAVVVDLVLQEHKPHLGVVEQGGRGGLDRGG